MVLRQKKIIVTGATGFVGQHLVPLLLKKNYNVVAIARDRKKAELLKWYDDVEFIFRDIADCKEQLKISPGMSLIHLAWAGLPNYESPLHFEENLPKSYGFIESCVNGGISHVLVSGTCFEYGLQSGQLASTSKTMPSNSYACAKDTLRQQLELFSKEKPFCLQWARLFYSYGEGQNLNSVISQLDTAIENGDPIFNMSGGEQMRDYLPIKALVQQLFELHELETEGKFNICSGKPISIRRLVEERIRENGSDIKLNLGHYQYPDYEPMAFWGVREIGETLHLPTLPNAPLEKSGQIQSLSPMRLRLNTRLNFVENEAFDESLIDYTEGYENSQAHSIKFQVHMKSVLGLLKKQLKPGSLIVEVGCGKGDFVEMVQADGFCKIQGYDASYSGKNSAIEKRYLKKTDRIKADLIILRHVVEHVPNPYKFLMMLKVIFGNTKIYIEVPNYDWILSNKTFFDITFEHVNYFSQQSLRRLFDPSTTLQGLLFEKQYQYVIADLATLNTEFRNLYRSDHWKYVSFDDLFPKLSENIERLNTLAEGKSVYVWGAATKGCLFLAHCARNSLLIDKVKFAIDINPNKIGKYLPGSFIQIKSKHDFFNSVKGDSILIISNSAYKEEISNEVLEAGLKQIQIETL